MTVTDLSIYSETKNKLAFNSTHIFENEIIKLVSLYVFILIGFPPAAVPAKHEANFIT